MKRSINYLIIFFLSLTQITSCTKESREYYVSPEGDDANPGSITEPWRTIGFAVNQVRSGTIHIQAGVYEEAVHMTESGSEEDPIIIQGEPGAIIDGSFGYNYPGRGLFNIENAAYIIVKGLILRNSQTHGFMVQGKSHHIEIRSCRTEHTRGSGIYVYGKWPFCGYQIHNIIIEDNEFYIPQDGLWDLTNVWQEDVTVSGGVEDFLIRSNYIEAEITGNQRLGPSGICIKSGARNGKVCFNTLRNIAGSGIKLNAGKSEIHKVDVFKNKVINTANFGIMLEAIEGGAIDSVRISHNLVVDARWASIACSDYNQSSNPVQPKTNIDLSNNTIFRSASFRSEGYSKGIWTEASYNCRIYNNIISGCKDVAIEPGRSGLLVTNNCLFNEQTGHRGEHPILADPLFRDTLAMDFSLHDTSPCRQYGVVMDQLCFDKLTSQRSGAVCDLGAWDLGVAPGR